jgi:hypothetical protein
MGTVPTPAHRHAGERDEETATSFSTIPTASPTPVTAVEVFLAPSPEYPEEIR